VIKVGNQYKTRSGCDVRIYAVDGEGFFPIHGAYYVEGGGWRPMSWTSEGRHAYDAGESKLDLVVDEPRVKHTYWINVHKQPNLASIWDREDVAKYHTMPSIIARVKVEIDVEEGHGL
jgi:hypothetical protein